MSQEGVVNRYNGVYVRAIAKTSELPQWAASFDGKEWMDFTRSADGTATVHFFVVNQSTVHTVEIPALFLDQMMRRAALKRTE